MHARKVLFKSKLWKLLKGRGGGGGGVRQGPLSPTSYGFMFI